MTKDMQVNNQQLGRLIGANKRSNYYELHYSTGEIARFYIIGNGIFRYFLDPDQTFTPKKTALINLPKINQQFFDQSTVRATSDSLIIHSANLQIIFNQNPATISVFDEELHRTRMEQSSPLELSENMTTEFLKQNKNEYYFGGGMQNGHFSHKGQQIEIRCDHLTGKGGVLTQVPFFWSNSGFGELRNTLQPGRYNFGKNAENVTKLSHDSGIFDNFYLIGNSAEDFLRKLYLLSGQPLMLPKYALGLGHVGNFVTTMWQPSQAKERNASKFNNNYFVRTTNPEQASGKASLNGEEKYQFSARAMIDRYQKAHFPLSWFVPNYQVADADQNSLTTFNDYAAKHNIHAGIWSQKVPDKLPANTSFIFSASSEPATLTADAELLQSKLSKQRPLILANYGIGKSQGKTALAFGTAGGNWDNIATQVASFLGASLSGQPFMGAAVDGISGGGNAQISVRDFEWKIFTPLLFYIDDQGNYDKEPFAYNKKMTQINWAYLQLRQQLKSYLYTLTYSAQSGSPILRPLFIEFPHEQVNYSEQFGSEFMLGANLLIAPITNGREDAECNSRKDNLYLPGIRTIWIDLFTGQKFMGGQVFNKLSYPTWHLPVFVRGGAIFDLGERNFLFYPQGTSSSTIYNDNSSTDFTYNHSETVISSKLSTSNLAIKIEPVQGNFNGMRTEDTTNLNIMCDSYPEKISVKINDEIIELPEYGTNDSFALAKEGFFYNTNYRPFPAFAQYTKHGQTALQIKLAKRNIANAKIEIIIANFNYGKKVMVHAITDSLLRVPKIPTVDPAKITAHSFSLAWPRVAQRVQVEINGLLYEGIDGNSFTFHELAPSSRYIIRMRYAQGSKVSQWSEYFGIITKRSATDYAIKDLQVESNFDSKPNYPLSYLTDLKEASEWQSVSGISEEKPLQLIFTFAKPEQLSRMTFVPRNIDHGGDPTSISIDVSADGENFAPYGEKMPWKADSKNKVIGLRGLTAKAIRLNIYQAVGNFAAGKEIIFFRAKR
ncbi:glycoside hydrolase family 31 protein [Lactobacillus sp. ESL0791]|uniref:TIM-barrel domain-containing protein n=1 Tax=Lactobacillus sp. ESL0791 TaxID=2983234 RepID=UPI0023F646DA|nr:TIM-barrel domain-containing protein [Lactobacillus sp. ESL0791]MDF7638154.1 glycoside hydrolase family 31 protein [Lactobacillus sp. ESL0791]